MRMRNVASSWQNPEMAFPHAWMAYQQTRKHSSYELEMTEELQIIHQNLSPPILFFPKAISQLHCWTGFLSLPEPSHWFLTHGLGGKVTYVISKTKYLKFSMTSPPSLSPICRLPLRTWHGLGFDQQGLKRPEDGWPTSTAYTWHISSWKKKKRWGEISIFFRPLNLRLVCYSNVIL